MLQKCISILTLPDTVYYHVLVTTKSARKGPLPEVPSADEVILRERRKDKSHESDILTSHSKDEFNPGAKVFQH